MKKRKRTFRYMLGGVLFAAALAALVFLHFGGFGTGKSADPAEFARYAQPVREVTVPEETRIIALGEATHGNAEFQQLKLELFRKMVEEEGVRAFALEGDFGGCEQANRYIHGGDGTAREAAAAIGFAIYRTEETAALLDYMRQYNQSAPAGEDLRLYGFDMQRSGYSLRFLGEACQELGVGAREMEQLRRFLEENADQDLTGAAEVLRLLKALLEGAPGADRAVHFAEMLLQYCALRSLPEEEMGDARDKWMAENVQWALEQEELRGQRRLFLSGHNGHVAKWGSFDSMGKLLSNQMGSGYYAIGTDFYKTRCNLPAGDGGRTEQTFYSHSPLAKAAKGAGQSICWLDLASLPQGSELKELAGQYQYMGNLGEGYSFFMRLLPQSYRIFQPPAVLYDSMIFVTEATPTRILPAP